MKNPDNGLILVLVTALVTLLVTVILPARYVYIYKKLPLLPNPYKGGVYVINYIRKEYVYLVNSLRVYIGSPWLRLLGNRRGL
jgi:hypothetical protein